MNDVPVVHAVMYRNYQIGTLCNSGAWGPPTLFSAVTDDVTCPMCREKLDGGRPHTILDAGSLVVPRGWLSVPHGPVGVPADRADADYLRNAARNIVHSRCTGSSVGAMVSGLLNGLAEQLEARLVPPAEGTPQNPVDGSTHPCPTPGYAGHHTAVGAGAISPPYRCHGCGTWFVIPAGVGDGS